MICTRCGLPQGTHGIDAGTGLCWTCRGAVAAQNPFEHEPALVTIHQDGLFSEPTFTVSKADYDKLKGENDQLWLDVERLRAKLAACAAGPWRTDVENEEFVDRHEYWLEYTHPWYPTEPDANYRGALEYVANGDHFTHPCHGIVSCDRIVAFAVPNLPQVTP